MKIITSLFILLFISSISFPQINPLIPDFKISEDNFQATFIQKNPKLFSNGNDEFIIAWEDFRNGDPSYFGQRFDSLGIKIGNNFQIQSNYNICFGANSSFLNLSSIYYDNLLSGGGSVSFYATIYNQNNNIVNQEINLGSINIPWCGTGYLGYDTEVCKTESGYLFGLRDNGFLVLNQLDQLGNLLYTYSFSDSISSSPVLGFDIASNNKQHFITTLQFIGEYYEFTDTLQLTATIITDDHLSDPIVFNINTLSPNEDSYYYSYQASTRIKNIALVDSSFLIIDLLNNSSNLTFRKYNQIGEQITQDSSVQLIENYIPDQYSYMSIYKFEVSQIYEDKIALYVSIDSSNTTFYNNIIIFDNEGNFLNVYSERNDTRTTFGGQPFILSDKEFFTTKTFNQDVFLYKNNIFNKLDSIKINDDQQGSNDIKPLVVPISESKYFITWNNEKGNYGKVIDENGITDEKQIPLEGKNTIFLNENRCVNFWKKKTYNDNAIIGFTLYDSEWNIIKKDTFQTGDYYAVSYTVQKITDSLFVINSGEPQNAKLLLYNFECELIKEKIITESDYSYIRKIFLNDASSFYVKWGTNLQLFNLNLEPISEIFQNNATEYLGDNKFLYVHMNSSYPIEQLAGIILSAEGDTLVNEFIFNQVSPNDFWNNNSKIIPISKSKFLMLFPMRTNTGEHIFWRVYNHDGAPENDKHIVHNKHSYKTYNISATINNDKIFFVWSDLREGNKGYDIYGNIYDLNVITEVKRPSIKDKFLYNFSLSQNYPNPFNPTTTIKYSIPTEVDENFASTTKLVVYDVLGREVITLVNKPQNPDNYQVTFDASKLSSGVYYYQLKVGSFIQTKKMVLLR